MSQITLATIARALGGQVAGRQVLAPGPGHSPKDRSLAVRLSVQSPDGFLAHSFAGDDWRLCRDHVAERLGLKRGVAKPLGAPEPQPTAEAEQRQRMERAAAIWAEARDPRGTVVERYLQGRGLVLPDDVAIRALRYHPACPWRDEARGETIRVPAMLGLMRNVLSDRVTAVHRTRLTPTGEKVDRRMYGVASGTAVKLDPDGAVVSGLAVGEGIETCLAGRQMGFRPVWALCSTSSITSLPVLPGVDTLTLFAEAGQGSERAIEACAGRWQAARREVLVIEPACGSDLNDALRGVA